MAKTSKRMKAAKEAFAEKHLLPLEDPDGVIEAMMPFVEQHL